MTFHSSSLRELQPVFHQYGNHKSQQHYAIVHDDTAYGGVISINAVICQLDVH